MRVYLPLLFYGILTNLGCGSLITELERIRSKSEFKTPVATSAITVIATDPADNSIGPFAQNYVEVVFSELMDASSIQTQSSFGLCAGNLQLSYDGFTNCFGLSMDASSNPRFRFTPFLMPKGLGLQVRTLAGIKNAAGIDAHPYQSSIGFRFAPPCGLQNCFFSNSTPLMTVATTISGIFLVQTGSLAGKYLVYTGGGPQTTLIDPVAATSEPGPSMAMCGTPGNGAHDFFVATGTNAGKQLIVQGGGTQNTCIFDPASNTFAAGPNLAALNASADGVSMQPDSGPDNQNTIFLRGNATTTVFRYTAGAGTITNTVMNTVGNIGAGAHAVRLVNGPNAGKWIIFNGATGTGTNYFDQGIPSVINTGFTTNTVVGAGASSFEVFTGARTGQLITVTGGGLGTSVFTLAAMTNGNAGPTLSGITSVAAGGLLLRHPNAPGFDAPLVVHGSNSTATSLYVPASGTFTAGPLTTGNIGSGASKIFMPSTGSAGTPAYLIVNGTSASTSVYLPSANMFHGSRMPSDMPTLGASAFPILGGPHSGKTLILGATGSTNTDTALYDPIKHEMTQGPSALGMPGSPSTFHVTFNQGPYMNQVLVFRGFNQPTFQVYNPATHSFSVPGGFPSSGLFNPMNTGGVAFALANDTRIFIANGGGSNAQTLDQVTGAVVNLGGLPVGVNAGPLSTRFVRPSTAAVKQLVFATSTSFLVIDHATLGVSTASTASPAGNGIQAFVIPSGAQANKVMVIHGGNTLLTSLLDPETNTFSVGPTSLSSCAGTGVGNGSKVLALSTGIHKGKFLLIAGNAQSVTCLYDPSTNSFSPGAPVSTNSSPGYLITQGSVAFPTGGGLYATGFILVSGITSNVWSTYVP